MHTRKKSTDDWGGKEKMNHSTNTATHHETLLLKAESSFGWMSGMPSGNFVTFFRGPFADAKVFVQERLKETLKHNPWLVGRLHKTSEGHGIALRWSDEALHNELDAIDKDESTMFHINPPGLKDKVHLNQPYEELCRITLKSSYVVPVGKTCLKKNLPLFTLSMVQVDSDSFVVLTSISHIPADGYTGYALLNMLLSPNPKAVLALDPNRDHSFNDKLKEAIGHQEKAILDFSLPGILNAIGKYLFLPRPKGFFFKLNMEAVEQEKIRFREKHNQPASSFVSTNDILCSTLSRMMGFSSLYMAVNFRRRFTLKTHGDSESKGEQLAGNYESGILFFEGDFDKAEQIRYAQGQAGAGRYQRGPNTSGALSPIPGFWKRTFGRPGIITNWSGWDSGFRLPNCEPILFLPLNELGKPFFETAIVFKHRDGEVGVMIFTRQLKSMSEIQDFSPIFGEAISDSLFPTPP